MKKVKYKKKRTVNHRNEQNDKVSESVSTYGLGNTYKTITISTLEDMENNNRIYSAKLTPLERMAYLFELNMNAFGHLLKSTPMSELWDKTIHIKDK